MARRLLIPAALTLALLFSGVVADSPVPAAGAAMVPPAMADPAPIAAPTFDVHLGDGMLRVRSAGAASAGPQCRSGSSCRASPQISSLVN